MDSPTCCVTNGSPMLDPWPQSTTAESVEFRFENDFAPGQQTYQPLPDREEYLRRLEHKLNKLKNGSQSDSTKRRQIIDQLFEARKTCLEHLVDSDDIVFESEQSTVRPTGLCTWINPEQPLSTTETQLLI